MATIDIRQEATGLRIILHGNLSFQTVEALRGKFQGVLSAMDEAMPLILDFGDVEMVDSMGLKLVLGLYQSCEIQSRPLFLENVSYQNGQVFKLCNLEERLNIRYRDNAPDTPS
ncbi:MAG: STAS domain-containing protein [Vampirovibrionales bacterium]|nr:STAS domain-containing protein [Vampirovibrionales bacterium]